MKLQFMHFNNSFIANIRDIFGDPEVQSRMSISDIDEFLKTTNSRLDYFLFVVLDKGEFVGILLAEILNYRTVGIAYAVTRLKRNQGYGKRLLADMVNVRGLIRYDNFIAYVDNDNLPSIRCLEIAGFQRDRTEEENEMYKYVLANRNPNLISIRSVDQSNWEDCIELKPSQEQQEFMASNLYSIAECN
ncbi:GNAT family N-acetyltransferase [Cohnella sp.]|uniref:GNAT family N-acetyltransferase n=1 Tax=Cohnella sp. TaxID=1883426 RepID=UPI003564F990